MRPKMAKSFHLWQTVLKIPNMAYLAFSKAKRQPGMQELAIKFKF